MKIFCLLFLVALGFAQEYPSLIPMPPESPSIQNVVQRKQQEQTRVTTGGELIRPPAEDDSLDLIKMSIDFVDADISEVLRTISAAYGISIIADKEVTGKVTVHLKDVAIREGLESICNANGLEVFREGHILRIRKASEKTINILKMNMQRIDLDVQNRPVKEFIKEFADKTGLKILAGSELTGNVTGSWKNVIPLDGFKALMEAHGYRIKQKNGFMIVNGEGASENNSMRQAARARGPGQGTMDIEVKDNRVSIHLEGADLQEVLRNIADQAKLNIVFYGESKEVVNATIANATFDEVFSTILKGSRFTYVLTPEGTLLVGEKGARSALSSSVLLPLRYLKSDNAMKMIPKSLFDGGLQITDVKEQNALLVTGAMSEIDNARQFLQLVDVPTLQIALECVIVEFNRGKGFSFGVNSGANKKMADGQPRVNGYVGLQGMQNQFKWAGGTAEIGMLPAQFDFELASMENASKAQVLARPSISTLNGNKASINVTNTSYTRIQQRSAEGLQITDFRPFNDGISLEITPSVTQAGEISIDIAPEIKTSANKTCEDCPRDVSTRTLRTTVNLRDGQTVRLGGLIRSSMTKTREFVPFLGSIPLLGWLFSFESEDEVNTELVIYITPRVIPANGVSTNLRQDIDRMSSHKDAKELIDVIAPKTPETKPAKP